MAESGGTRSKPRGQIQRGELVALAVLTLLALVLRLYRLDYRGMWTDEFHTLNAVLMSWQELIVERLRNGHLPTYFLLLKSWVTLAGSSDWALRFPSAVVGALLVPATAYCVFPSLPRRLAWIVVGIAVVNGTALWSSQEARMYSMLLVAATFSHGAFARAVIGGEKKAWWIYGVATLLAVSLQPVMILWVVAQGIAATALAQGDQRPILMRWLGVVVVVLPAVAVLLLWQEKRTLRFDQLRAHELIGTVWGNAKTLLSRLGLTGFGVSADSGRWRALTSVLVIVMLVLARRFWLGRRRANPQFAASAEGRFLVLCGYLVAVPLILLYLGSLVLDHIVGNARYLIPLCVPLWVLCVWGTTNVPSRRWRDALVVAGTIFLVVGAVRQWRDKGLGGREIVYYVNRHALPGDVIVCRATPTLVRMIEHYGARPLRVCPVPEPSARRVVAEEDAYEFLVRCLGEARRFWVIEYRGKGSFLRQVLARRPEEFGVLKEVAREQTRAILVVRRTVKGEGTR